MLQGCFQSVPAPRPVDNGQYLVHIVTAKVDSLPRVVQWYTGLKVVPQDVIALNGELNSRPLRQGDKVLIPTKLVTRTDAPPVAKLSRSSNRSLKGKGGNKVASSKTTVKARERSERTDEQAAVNQDATANGSQVASGTDTSKDQNNVGPASLNGGATIGGAAIGGGKPAKSVEDMLREEQAEVERLKGELGEAQ